MRKSREGVHRSRSCGAADEALGAPEWRAISRAGCGFLFALAMLPGGQCSAAPPTLADVVDPAGTADLLARNAKQWDALERFSEDQEVQRLRAALAPEQWIAVPLSRHRAPRRTAR